MEALIQELPKFMLKAVPTDCSECPICLEEFHLGNEVMFISCSFSYPVHSLMTVIDLFFAKMNFRSVDFLVHITSTLHALMNGFG